MIRIMYYSLPFYSSLVIFLGRLVLTISILNPTDDLESTLLLSDSTSPPPSQFLADDNEFLSTTTDASLPDSCDAAAAQDDLSSTQEGTNLFSRQTGAQCLPPVNIGADTLQLFEAPLDSLESIIFPLKGETSDDPPPAEFPGLLPGGEQGDLDLEKLESLGWQPYAGAVHFEAPENSACPELTAHRGDFRLELCCNAMYVGYEAQSAAARSQMANIDAGTIANQDIAVIYNCICTFFGLWGRSGGFQKFPSNLSILILFFFGSRHSQRGLSLQLFNISSLLQSLCKSNVFHHSRHLLLVLLLSSPLRGN